MLKSFKNQRTFSSLIVFIRNLFLFLHNTHDTSLLFTFSSYDFWSISHCRKEVTHIHYKPLALLVYMRENERRTKVRIFFEKEKNRRMFVYTKAPRYISVTRKKSDYTKRKEKYWKKKEKEFFSSSLFYNFLINYF